jgi:hypothetical protein
MIVSNFGLFINFRYTFVLTHVLGNIKNLKCWGFLVFIINIIYGIILSTEIKYTLFPKLMYPDNI